MQELAKAHAGVPSIDRADAHAGASCCRCRRATAPSTCCCPTARRCGRTARRGCTGCSGATRSRARDLADEDLSVDFAALTTPTDRVAVVATEPLTTGEDWQTHGAGELRVFVDGAPLELAPRHRPEGLPGFARGALGQAVCSALPHLTGCNHVFRAHDDGRPARSSLRHLLSPRRADAACCTTMPMRGPTWCASSSIGKQPRGPRHLAGGDHAARHRRGHRQAGVLGRRQHPRRRAHRQHRLPVLAAPAGHRLRPATPGHHAAARHARGLPVPAPEPRRRRARAGRPAAPHPLVDAALSVRRTARSTA